MSYRTTTTFQALTANAVRNGKCPSCGKRTRRTRTFECTVSPYNRKEDGTPRSVAEVRRQVAEKANAWAPGPEAFEHSDCREVRLAIATEATSAELSA